MTPLPESGTHLLEPTGRALELRSTRWGVVLATHGESLGDVVAGVVHLLSFAHEAGVPRDRYGRVPARCTTLATATRTPLLENAAALFSAALRERFPELTDVPCPWGKGRVVVAVTHDVDGPELHRPFPMIRSLLYAAAGRRYERNSFELGLATWLLGRPDPYWTFDDWVRLNRSAFDAPSTFYFYPGRVLGARRHRNDPHYPFGGPRYEDQLRRLRDAGCEIGVHFGIGARSAADFRSAARRVAEVACADVVGSRMHYWAGAWPNPYPTWEAMQDAGLAYDASLSPLDIGFRAGIAQPLIPSFRRSRDLDSSFVVLPTSVMDGYAHSRYTDQTAGQVNVSMDETVEVVLRTGFLVVDWHERALANVGAWAGFMESYFRLLAMLRERADVEFVTAAEAARRWRTHAADLLVPYGDSK